MSGARPAVIISANSFWNIANFRAGLIEALVSDGFQPVIVAPGVNDDWAAALGAQAIDIAIDRSGLNPLRDAQLLLKFWRLLRQIRPAAFLGFTVKPNIYGSLAARLAGVPALPNISGLGTAFISDGPLSSFVGLLYRLALGKAARVFFQNPDDRDLFLARRLVRREQTQLLPGSGIDLRHFAPAPVRAEGPPTFLFIGRLLRDKGVREFIEAVRLLRQRHRDWRWQLLGPLDEQNRTAISRNELDGWIKDGTIEYLGTAEDIRPFIEQATAVVLPSYREGLPRSLLEGAAMGRPLIATDVPGNRHLVEDGVNGLLCDARNGPSLAGAMERLGMMDVPNLGRLGAAGRARVEQEFGEEHVIDAYRAALLQLSTRTRV